MRLSLESQAEARRGDAARWHYNFEEQTVMAVKIPERARVVILGGGVIGASIAYHLAKRDVKDIVLLERDRIASGTTWHAAGVIGRLRESKAQSELAQYTADLLMRFEEETGQATGYRENGSLSIELTP